MTDAQFNPDEHTVAEVNDYLREQHDAEDGTLEIERVLDAERAGQNRKGIVGEPTEPTYDAAVERDDVGQTAGFIVPSHNTVSQADQEDDAARRNEELAAAGVIQEQGFIGTDGAANLLS